MSLDATRWAWQRKIKPTEKLVLLSMADRSGEDHRCYPSIGRLALDTGLNRKTVLSVLGRLRDSGLIAKTGRMTGGNKSVPEYQLLGVRGREDEVPEAVPKSGHSPECDHAQKRDGCHTQNRDTHHTQNWANPKTGIAQNRGEGHTQNRADHHTQKRATESTKESTIESPTYYSEHETSFVQEKQCEIFCTLPLNDGSEFEVTQELVAELVPLYPNVDVLQALRAMKGWLIGNQKRRKTRRGIKAFITSWLSREQDKPRAAGSVQQQGQVPQPRSYRECMDLEQRQELEYLNQLREGLNAPDSVCADSLGAGQTQPALASGESVSRN